MYLKNLFVLLFGIVFVSGCIGLNNGVVDVIYTMELPPQLTLAEKVDLTKALDKPNFPYQSSKLKKMTSFYYEYEKNTGDDGLDIFKAYDIETNVFEIKKGQVYEPKEEDDARFRLMFDKFDNPEYADFYPGYRGEISEEHINIQGVPVWHMKIKIVSEKNETQKVVRNINIYYIKNIDAVVIRVTFAQNEVYIGQMYLETLIKHLKSQNIFSFK